MPSDLASSLDPVRDAVSVAARLCLEAADGGTERIDKAGREPVTVADFGSQAVLLKTISEHFPEDRVRAEEKSSVLLSQGEGVISEVVDAVARALDMDVTREQVLGWIDHRGVPDADRQWAVDPIDGTKGFLRGDQFAIAVGLVAEGRPVAGVLGCPRLTVAEARGVVGWGTTEEAFIDDADGSRRLEVSTISDPGGTRLLGSVESSHGDPAQVTAVMEALGLGGGWVRIDSQAKYLTVAAGLAEIYLRPQSRPDWRERVWDHAAGAALVVGAGGRVTDTTGRELDFSRGDHLEENRGVLVTNGALHSELVEVLA